MFSVGTGLADVTLVAHSTTVDNHIRQWHALSMSATVPPIAMSLRKGGFTLTQIARQGSWVVYEQSIGGRVVCHELVKIQSKSAEAIMGKPYPAREVYPGNYQWGTLAWSVTDRYDAMDRMHSLAAENNKSEKNDPRTETFRPNRCSTPRSPQA